MDVTGWRGYCKSQVLDGSEGVRLRPLYNDQYNVTSLHCPPQYKETISMEALTRYHGVALGANRQLYSRFEGAKSAPNRSHSICFLHQT